MLVLGLSIGQLSTAALLADGKIVAAAHEERFSRLKNDERYPRRAIDYCLAHAGISGDELDAVVIAGNTLAFGPWVTRAHSTFSIADHLCAQRDYWHPRLYGKQQPLWTDVFRHKLDLEQFPGTFEKLLDNTDSYYSEENWPALKAEIHAGIMRHLGLGGGRIHHREHHECHAAYAYWGSPFRGGETLVLTVDAFGDGLSATVNRVRDGRMERLLSIPHTEFRLARLYRYMTLLLGMKPNEHEYKLMGLAPYAKHETLRGPYQVFKETMLVDGLRFRWKVDPPDMYYFFKERLEGFRFDGIAGGLQLYVEDVLTEWVANAARAYGIRQIAISGGISMNIKANKAILELPEVDELFVCGSGSDESLAIGACYAYAESQRDVAGGKALGDTKAHSMYLGPAYDSRGVREWVKSTCAESRYSIEYDVSPGKAAAYLAEGRVIGRMAGRMEFGQRSLGNRSILADPRRGDTIDKINRKIKNRDFWMPFAPTVLAEDEARYVVNPKKAQSPHMTIGFDSTEQAKCDLAATLHPSDKTLRAQILRIGDNPGYYELISAFKRETGVGALLNTSFNLHGEPIVCSPDDALHVLDESDIDMILLEDVAISRRKG